MNIPSFSVIIPIYNELDRIFESIKSTVTTLNQFEIKYELILVNDGSTDGSGNELNKFVNDPKVRILNKSNGGIGSTIRAGIQNSSFPYIIFVPVDSPLTPKVFRSFYTNLDKADILVSYRIARVGYSLILKFNSWIYNKIVRYFFGLKIRDVNWIHLYKRAIFEKGISIEYDGIFMLAEILIKAKRKNCTIFEFPVEMIKRNGGVSTAGSFKTGIKTGRDLFHFLLKKNQSIQPKSNIF